MLVDSHCHLDFPDFEGEHDGLIARARAAGVAAMLTIGTRPSQFAQVRDLAERYDEVWCSVGLHPHDAAAEPDVDEEALIALAQHPKAVAIGETGLDYHYEHSPRPRQQESFRAHARAARACDLPLVVHARDADDDVADILAEEMAAGPFRGVIHCFTAGRALAERALEMGLYISFSGIVTFKNAGDIRAIARDVPAERLLVETDAPYLAPVPHRGKRNAPEFLPHTATHVAELRAVPLEELAAQTTRNFHALFSKARAP